MASAAMILIIWNTLPQWIFSTTGAIAVCKKRLKWNYVSWIISSTLSVNEVTEASCDWCFCSKGFALYFVLFFKSGNKSTHQAYICYHFYTPAPPKVKWGYTGFIPMSVRPSDGRNILKKTIGYINFIPGIYPYVVSLLTPIHFRVPGRIVGPLVAENGVSGIFWKNVVLTLSMVYISASTNGYHIIYIELVKSQPLSYTTFSSKCKLKAKRSRCTTSSLLTGDRCITERRLRYFEKTPFMGSIA